MSIESHIFSHQAILPRHLFVFLFPCCYYKISHGNDHSHLVEHWDSNIVFFDNLLVLLALFPHNWDGRNSRED